MREDADTYAASKRKEADDQAAQILEKAGEDAASQIEDRRKAAQVELEDLQGRIAELQSREAAITQRVSELRSMFNQGVQRIRVHVTSRGGAAWRRVASGSARCAAAQCRRAG